MSKAEELILHRAINARMEASERARAAPQRVATLTCVVCEHNGAAGDGGTGWINAMVGRETWVFCSRGCVERHQKNAPAAGLPLAVTIAAEPSKATFGAPKTITIGKGAKATSVSFQERELISTCAFSGCKARFELWQRKVGDGEWTPDEQATFTISGWVATPQGKFCGTGHAADARPKAEHVRHPVAVTAPIVAVEIARATARAGAARSAAESLLAGVGGSREQTTTRKGAR
jgi:hypothetical protein